MPIYKRARLQPALHWGGNRFILALNNTRSKPHHAYLAQPLCQHRSPGVLPSTCLRIFCGRTFRTIHDGRWDAVFRFALTVRRAEGGRNSKPLSYCCATFRCPLQYHQNRQFRANSSMISRARGRVAREGVSIRGLIFAVDRAWSRPLCSRWHRPSVRISVRRPERPTSRYRDRLS